MVEDYRFVIRTSWGGTPRKSLLLGSFLSQTLVVIGLIVFSSLTTRLDVGLPLSPVPKVVGEGGGGL